ncbi:hypothetical protein ACFQE5_01550 [Pseudonocardia hispaniensis]|uniref:Uncharacterized protein n=1 Tax=Pseudonocardia hispaniensis TaxID=904933 RepID=A0ABW1IWN4_9PSEU
MTTTFYITFGSAHHGDNPPRHRDGWWTVHAPNELAARLAVIERIGRAWSWIYTPDTFDPAFFPAGELHVITVPATPAAAAAHHDAIQGQYERAIGWTHD